jgi:5-(carboxyamino)imidazole ribonucleotide mutase
MPIDDKFKQIIQSNQGCAVIMAGSGSDKPHIDEIVKSLKKYEIPFEVRVCSAHKQPDELAQMIYEYNQVGGSVVYIAVAGGTDALSGTLSFYARGPVISCPPDAPNQSCLTNPPGSSNAYIAKPGNVGRFIAQIYAGVNPKLMELLARESMEKIQSLKDDDAKLRAEYKGE